MELDEADGLGGQVLLPDPVRQQFVAFLQSSDGQLAPDAVPAFVRFCFECDTGGGPQLPPSAGMQLVIQGCDKVLQKIVDGLAPSVASHGPCGKRIAKQQHAYKCLDCGADPTCVMCVECFKESPCINHNFRLVKSGGGSCDCGDPEAWKPESFCSRHRCAAHHAPACGHPRAAGGSAPADAPGSALADAPGAPESAEAAAAAAASKGLFDEVLLIVRAAISAPGGATPWDEAHGELPRLYTSALQSDCQNLLQWLNRKAGEHAVFRSGIAQALLSPIPGAGDHQQTVISWALRVHWAVPETLQTGMEDLIHSLLVLYDFKANFGATFSRLYLELLQRRHREELHPDTRPRERWRDVLIFSVQLFTVPSMAVQLVTDPTYGQLSPTADVHDGWAVSVQGAGLLDGMLLWLLHHLNASAPGPGGVRPADVEARDDDPAPPLDECVDFRARMLGRDGKAWRRMSIDMRYLLRHLCVATTLVRPQGRPRAGTEPVSSFRTLLRILRRFQVADPVVRQRGEHVRYEPRAWQKTLQIIPIFFDIYLLALAFIYIPAPAGGAGGGAH